MIAFRRIAKRILYLLLAIGLVALVVGIILFFFWNPFRRPPVVPPVSQESVVIERVETIPHDGTIDLIARVRNPNPRAGVSNYRLTFVLLNSANQAVHTTTESTYLLPGSLKYIAVLDVAVSEPIERVRVEQPGELVFTTVDLASSQPVFSSFLRGRTIKDVGNQRMEVQVGVITNSSNFGYGKVDITGISLDAQDRVIGVGKTFVGELQAGEQREFTLQWPQPFSETAKIIVLPDTDIYHADNILPVLGDPARLRDQVTDLPEQ
jgi:hypothetical protein